VNVTDNFKALEFGSISGALHLPLDCGLEFGAAAQRSHLTFFRNSVLSGPLLGDLCIGDDDGNKHALRVRVSDSREECRQGQARATRLKRVAVNKRLSYEGASSVCVLDLLGSHVLALAQLEDVLLAVDDSQSTVGQPLADVTTVQDVLVRCMHAHHRLQAQPVEPAFRVERFGCLLGRLVISAEDVGASEANFSARRVRGRQIVHFRDVAQANFVARHGAADVAGRHVTNARESGGSAAPGATR
jgi:hypothetical protein